MKRTLSLARMLNVFQLMIALGVDWLTITAGPPWPWMVAAPPTTDAAFGPGRYRRDPKRQQRRGGEQHAAHVRQACHVIAKRLAGCRIARGAGVAEDFGRSCRSSNEIVARSKTRGQVLRACPAENRLLQVRFLRPLVRWCHQQPNEFKRQIEEGVLLFQMDLSLPQ